MMRRKTRVMIVGDYPAVRADLRTVLELVEGVEVVGEYTGGEYTGGEYSEGEYTECEYTECEYSGGEYSESESIEGEHTNGESTGGVLTGSEAAAAEGSPLHLARACRPDIILIDLDLDRRERGCAAEDGTDDAAALVRRIVEVAPGAVVYGLSTLGREVFARSAPPPGVGEVFTKGIDTDRLMDHVRNFKPERERKAVMQQTNQLQPLGAVEQARPAALTQAKAGTRLAYIDSIRMVLIILVIMVHAAVTYGALGSWTYLDPAQDALSPVLLSLFVIACQSFFMGLFFFYAGYFTPGSYDRKGLGSFWKDRLLRLGIPLVAYTWFLSKIPNYIDDVANNGMTMTFWQYATRQFWSDADEGPTWFLFALLIFSAGYTLLRLASRRAGLGQRLSRLPVPSTRALLLVGLLMAGLTFAVSQVWPVGVAEDVLGIFSLLLPFFPTYIILFAGGILAYRSDWLARLPGETLRFWSWFSAALLAALPVLLLLGGAAEGMLEAFMTGLNWRCASFCLWLGLAAVSFSVTLTLWLRARVQPTDRLAAYAGPNSFAVYLIHPLVLVPITLGLSYLPIHAMLKFGLASLTTVAVCYPLAAALRRIPGLRAIL